MLVKSQITLDDGRAFELTMEPLFDRVGYKLRDLKIHMIQELDPNQLNLGGDIAAADKRLTAVG
jgi:hypothetical protein